MTPPSSTAPSTASRPTSSIRDSPISATPPRPTPPTRSSALSSPARPIGCIIGGLIGGAVSPRIGRKRGLVVAAPFLPHLRLARPRRNSSPHRPRRSRLRVELVFIASSAASESAWPPCSRPCTSRRSPLPKSAAISSPGTSSPSSSACSSFTSSTSASPRPAAATSAQLHRLALHALLGAIPAGLFLLLLFLVPETPAISCSRATKPAPAPSSPSSSLPKKAPKSSPRSAPRSASITWQNAFLGALAIFRQPIFQQFVGINVVLYYATDIFEGMGLTNASLSRPSSSAPSILPSPRSPSSASIVSAAVRSRSSELSSWPPA